MSHSNPNVSSRQPWGVWPTLGLSALILGGFFLSGAIVAGLYLGWEIQQNPALADPSLRADFLLNASKNGNALACSSLVSGVMGLGAVALAIKMRSQWTIQAYLNLNWPKWSTLVVWNALLVALLVVEEMIAKFFAKKSDFLEDLLASDQTNYVWLWVAVVIMAPLFEEVFFRGFMFKGLEKSWIGPIGTILITSLVWTVIHVQYDLFFLGIIFSLGLLFGYARYASKSLWVPISMHALNNGLAMVGTSGWLHSCILN